VQILKILSVIAAVLYFPLGIPAMYFAFRTQREFDEGIMQGNIDRALKFARRTEHLLILSLIALILTIVLIFALIERAQNNYKTESNYIAHNGVNG
jgi:hypothetical protein